MANIHITRFQAENTFRFYELNKPQNSLYNTRWQTQNSFADAIKPWQTLKGKVDPYQHKCMFNDPITIMVHTQVNGTAGTNAPTLNVLNNKQVVIGSIDLSDTLYYQGVQANANDTYTDPATGFSYAMQCSLWAFTLGAFLTDNSADTGTYYLQLSSQNDDGAIKLYNSEAIFLFDDCPNTVLIQATADTNKNGVIIDNWGNGLNPVFSQRVEADIRKNDLYTMMASYLTGQYLQRNQDAQNWKSYLFQLGGNTSGVPDFIWWGVEALFDLDTIQLDGYNVMYDDGQGGNGAEIKKRWSKTENDTNPLIYAELPIREQYAQQNVYTSPAGNRIHLVSYTMSIGGVTPVAVTQLTMQMGATVITIPVFICYTHADLINKLAYLNGTFAPANGLLGTFEANSVGATAYIDYINDATETFLPVLFGVYAFTQRFTFSGSGQGTISYSIARATLGISARTVVDWGFEDMSGNEVVESHFATGAGLNTFSQNAGLIASLPNFSIFHSGSSGDPHIAMGQLSLIGATPLGSTGLYATLINSGNALPSTLNSFVLKNQGFESGFGAGTDNFDNTGLSDCASSLQHLDLSNSAFSTVSGNLFDGATWSKLTFINISGNNLNTASINAIALSFSVNASPLSSTGIWASGGQATGDHPSGAAVAFLDHLSSIGWTVTY